MISFHPRRIHGEQLSAPSMLAPDLIAAALSRSEAVHRHLFNTYPPCAFLAWNWLRGREPPIGLRGMICILFQRGGEGWRVPGAPVRGATGSAAAERKNSP